MAFPVPISTLEGLHPASSYFFKELVRTVACRAIEWVSKVKFIMLQPHFALVVTFDAAFLLSGLPPTCS